MSTLPESKIVHDYYQNELHRLLTTDTWSFLHSQYAVPDTRPWWKRKLSAARRWAYWRTVGRFKAWLHRDCGD